MGRSPCCDKAHTNKGAWTKQEDDRLVNYINSRGEGCWRSVPRSAGLQRCGKSCRLRWVNYLRPDIRRGNFTQDEDRLIVQLQSLHGNKFVDRALQFSLLRPEHVLDPILAHFLGRWSQIAAHLPGRTDNEIKNYWNTRIKKKLMTRGIDPQTHRPLNAPNSPSRSNTSLINTEKGSHLQFTETKNPNFMATNNVVEGLGGDEDSNNSVVTDEDQVVEGVNLDLSISLLSSSSTRVLHTVNVIKQEQERQYSFVSRAGPTNASVCLCCRLGFRNPKSSCDCFSMTTTITYDMNN